MGANSYWSGYAQESGPDQGLTETGGEVRGHTGSGSDAIKAGAGSGRVGSVFKGEAQVQKNIVKYTVHVRSSLLAALPLLVLRDEAQLSWDSGP